MTKHSLLAPIAIGVALALVQSVPAQVQGGVPGNLPTAPDAAPPSGGSRLPAEWGRFAPEGAGFSVLMPGTPKGEERTFQLESGKAAKSAVYTLRQGGLEYIVTYSPLAVDIRDEALAKALFDRAQDGAVARLKAKVLDEQSITVAGRPGRRIKLVASNTFVEMYSILSDYKIISLIVETYGTVETPEITAAATRYFESLDTTH